MKRIDDIIDVGLLILIVGIAIYIEMYTFITWGLFPPVITYITKMAIPLIMILIILSVLMLRHIGGHTPLPRNGLKGKTRIWQRLGHWLHNGIEAKRGASGIENMANGHGINVNRASSYASNAGKNTSPKLDMEMSDFAHVTVERALVAYHELMTNGEIVNGVSPSSSAINIQSSDVAQDHAQLISVGQIEKLNRTGRVYNLKVNTVSEYFANGVLVSNCDALRYLLYNFK
jgi:hypothetical protein